MKLLVKQIYYHHHIHYQAQIIDIRIFLRINTRLSSDLQGKFDY